MGDNERLDNGRLTLVNKTGTAVKLIEVRRFTCMSCRADGVVYGPKRACTCSACHGSNLQFPTDDVSPAQ